VSVEFDILSHTAVWLVNSRTELLRSTAGARGHCYPVTMADELASTELLPACSPDRACP
jgi:hypothetical protein